MKGEPKLPPQKKKQNPVPLILAPSQQQAALHVKGCPAKFGMSGTLGSRHLLMSFGFRVKVLR